jgi:hypothetical protein
MFFLARPIVGSFYALLAMIVLGMGPTTLWLSIIPNSHAPALCFVVWGMFFLLRWMQSERWWIGAIAGLLLGYAVTIRYSEALLLFPLYFLHQVQADEFIGPKLHIVLKLLGLLPIGPIGIAAISRVKWRSWRSYISAAAPVMAWAVPVAALVLFNLFTIGHVTGYDGTNEGQGFALKYFFEKWEFAIEQIHLFGLFIFAPLGVAGLILMFRSHRLTALLLTLWFVPGALLYTAYYWGLNQPGVWYLRFFLTLFPPMIVAAMFLLRNTQRSAGRSIASPLAAGVLTAIAASIGLWGSLHELTRQYRGNLNLHYSAREILTHIKSPAGSRPMILADQGMFPQLLQYMQFMYDADWYANDIFAIRAGGGFGLAGMFEKRKPDDNSPVALQRERIEYIDNLRKGKTDADFVQELHRLMDAALNSNRRVYLVLAPSGRDVFKARYITAGYQMTEIDRWDEPCNTSFDGNELSPSVIPDVILLPWHRQRWGMYEIRHAPATQPSVAVSSR